MRFAIEQLMQKYRRQMAFRVIFVDMRNREQKMSNNVANLVRYIKKKHSISRKKSDHQFLISREINF